MPNGQDGRINKKFNILTFLGDPKLTPLHEDTSFLKSGKGLDLENPGLKQGAEEGFNYIINKKRNSIDDKYGLGASDWLFKSRDLFDPEDKFKLYYLFSDLPDNNGIPTNKPFNPYAPPEGQNGGSLETNPFPGGKVRG